MTIKEVNKNYVIASLASLYKENMSEYKYDITPATIQRLSEKSGIKIEWQKVKLIYDDDNDNYKLYLEEFINSSLTLSEIIVITDECISEDKYFLIKISDFKRFIIDEYPRIIKMDFFQPHDILLIDLTAGRIFMMHHEGYYTTVSTPN